MRTATLSMRRPLSGGDHPARHRHRPPARASVQLLRDGGPAGGSSPVVTERRAADVAVLGGGMAALLTALSLARAGKKVLVLPDYGLAAPSSSSGQPRRLQPLKLPDADPLLVHLAAEAAPYWRGLEVLSGATILQPQDSSSSATSGSADLVLDPEGDHAGAVGFAQLQDACAGAGVPTSLLSGAEAAAAFRLLQVPDGHGRAACLLQPDGAVLRAREAAGAARQLCTAAGVMLREGLVLQGWRDRGSCFELRATSKLAPDLTCLYEAEVLLLAPGTWQQHCLRLFRLQMQGLQTREVLRCTLATSSPELLLQSPVLQSWGAAAAADAPQQPQGLSLLPSGTAGDPCITLQQQAAWGLTLEQPFDWRPAAVGSMLQQQQQGGNTDGGPASSSSSRKASGAAVAMPTWADLQVAQFHASASQLLRGLGPLEPDGSSGASGLVSVSSSLVGVTPDGRPLLDSHPGFDAGRVVLCCAASGGQAFGPGSSSAGGYQLTPILAKLAADVIRAGGCSRGGGGDDGSEQQQERAQDAGAVLTALGLRQGLRAEVSAPQDSWDGLGRLQAAQVVDAVGEEERADLASDAVRDAAGTRQ